jgi:hypothetical protein
VLNHARQLAASASAKLTQQKEKKIDGQKKGPVKHAQLDCGREET